MGRPWTRALSVLRAAPAAPRRLRVPQHRNGLVDLPDTHLRLLRALGGADVLSLVAVGKAIVGVAGRRIGDT